MNIKLYLGLMAGLFLTLLLLSWRGPKKYLVYKVHPKPGYWLVVLKEHHRPNYMKEKYACSPDTMYVGKEVWR